MAKAKKRATARKKSAKRVKPARRKTSMRATVKKRKSRVRRAAKSTTKPAAAEIRTQEEVVVEKTVEITVVPAIEESTPGAVVVAETVRPATSAPAEGENKANTGAAEDFDIRSADGEPPQQKVA
jgi:hypothetical protein